MCFNVMAANCDDHTKNLAFILKRGEPWNLAPAYDLSGRWTYQHFMSVSGAYRDITTDHLLAVAERFAIGTGPKVLQQVRDAVALWPTIARANGVPEAELIEVARHHQLLYGQRPAGYKEKHVSAKSMHWPGRD